MAGKAKFNQEPEFKSIIVLGLEPSENSLRQKTK